MSDGIWMHCTNSAIRRTARQLGQLYDDAMGDTGLKGTQFMHFGAFFSRAFRENDYLLGRLQAIDRLIDIVCDSAGREALADVDVQALKRQAFEHVLRREEAHLPHVRSLVDSLRSELCRTAAR